MASRREKDTAMEYELDGTTWTPPGSSVYHVTIFVRDQNGRRQWFAHACGSSGEEANERASTIISALQRR